METVLTELAPLSKSKTYSLTVRPALAEPVTVAVILVLGWIMVGVIARFTQTGWESTTSGAEMVMSVEHVSDWRPSVSLA